MRKVFWWVFVCGRHQSVNDISSWPCHQGLTWIAIRSSAKMSCTGDGCLSTFDIPDKITTAHNYNSSDYKWVIRAITKYVCENNKYREDTSIVFDRSGHAFGPSSILVRVYFKLYRRSESHHQRVNTAPQRSTLRILPIRTTFWPSSISVRVKF